LLTKLYIFRRSPMLRSFELGSRSRKTISIVALPLKPTLGDGGVTRKRARVTS
jgi:hypothetical protein